MRVTNEPPLDEVLRRLLNTPPEHKVREKSKEPRKESQKQPAK